MDTLSITSGPQGDIWVITATLTSHSTLPAEIFLYENTGETELGRYIGVCDIEQLGLYQIWTGQAIPRFGNAYVRHTQAKITLPLGVSSRYASVISNLTATAKSLKTSLTGSGATTTTSVTL
jgi:hypothetical protein